MVVVPRANFSFHFGVRRIVQHCIYCSVNSYSDLSYVNLQSTSERILQFVTTDSHALFQPFLSIRRAGLSYIAKVLESEVENQIK